MTEGDMPKRNVYIIGAQCTGKTTLVNALEEDFSRHNGLTAGQPQSQPSIIREVARTVLREKQFNREDITSSPSRALQLQKHILNAQWEAEKAATNGSTTWYICDRSGLDPIVYAHLFVGEEAATEMAATEAWKDLQKRMRTGIVVLCEAGCNWLVDDGTRLMPAGMEDWMRVDAAFRKLLVARGIGFTVVSRDVVRLEERIALVKGELGLRTREDGADA